MGMLYLTGEKERTEMVMEEAMRERGRTGSRPCERSGYTYPSPNVRSLPFVNPLLYPIAISDRSSLLNLFSSRPHSRYVHVGAS
jgi:hypothetical protein